MKKIAIKLSKFYGKSDFLINFLKNLIPILFNKDSRNFLLDAVRSQYNGAFGRLKKIH